MKKIDTVEIVPVTHTSVQMTMFPTSVFEAVSGMQFKTEIEAIRHENYIVNMKDYYRKLLKLFGIDYLKGVRDDWEEKRLLWKGHPQYRNYVAGQYALNSIISEYEDKRSIESIFNNLRRGYYD